MKKFKKIIGLLLMMMMFVSVTKVDIASAKANEDYSNGPNIEIKNLTKTQEENLFKLCKIWGFAKYYHPEVADGKFDWDDELFKIMPKVLNEKSPSEVDKIIYKWINDLGKVEEGAVIAPSSNIKLSANTGWIKDTKFISSDLSKLLVKIETCKRTGTNHYIDFVKQVRNPIFTNEKEYAKMSFSDDAVKLLGLFRYWNMIEYFNPNRHLMDENWDTVLKEFIPKMVNEDSEVGYKLNLHELIGKIQDGHAIVFGIGEATYKFFGSKTAPVCVEFIEGKVVVTKILQGISGLNVKVGDVILKIDGENIDNIIKEKSKYYPSTSTNYNNDSIKYLLLRTEKDSLNLTIERDKDLFDEKVLCSADNFRVYDAENVPSHKILNNNILYINPSKLAKDEIYDIMDKSMATKGLIVDLRYYPSDFLPYKLGYYLMPNPVEYVKCSRVNEYRPGEFLVDKTISTGQVNPDYYKGKVILLIDRKSMSQPEFTTMALRKAPKAKVVGENSAGADGNVSTIVLPGMVKTRISGIGVYYPDGTETQKIGIVPDVRVSPTIQGIKEGRDEILEKAIEIINQ